MPRLPASRLLLVLTAASSARGESDPTCVEKCEYRLPPGVGKACEDTVQCGGCARCQPDAILCEPADEDDVLYAASTSTLDPSSLALRDTPNVCLAVCGRSRCWRAKCGAASTTTSTTASRANASSAPSAARRPWRPPRKPRPSQRAARTGARRRLPMTTASTPSASCATSAARRQSWRGSHAPSGVPTSLAAALIETWMGAQDAPTAKTCRRHARRGATLSLATRSDAWAALPPTAPVRRRRRRQCRRRLLHPCHHRRPRLLHARCPRRQLRHRHRFCTQRRRHGRRHSLPQQARRHSLPQQARMARGGRREPCWCFCCYVAAARCCGAAGSRPHPSCCPMRRTAAGLIA